MDDILAKRAERKEKICELIKSDIYTPMKEKELAVFMQVDRSEREELSSILEELVIEGKLMTTSRGKYVKGDGSIFSGTFRSKSGGFGFVEVDGSEEDLYIPADKTGGAYNNDTVQVELLNSHGGKRREAKVVRVLRRNTTFLVGVYDACGKGYGFVIPDDGRFDSDIYVPVEHSMGAMTGHKVVVTIDDYDGRNPSGRVSEIIGHVNDPGVDILSIVKAYEIPVEFPEKVINQASKAAKDVSDADMAGRRDLREIVMVTIDGEDAKDLDDAVSLDFDGIMYHLGVHIADVANYVQENSALDREALKRGTSVYLTDRVIPMLPHSLSNGICSLNAGHDRLALSCLMKIDLSGDITDYEICESVIRVDRRMTYTAVRTLLDDSLDENDKEIKALKDEYQELLPMFRQMKELSRLLREKRRRRGAIDFDFPECKIIVDCNGCPKDIKPYERNVATDIIEDFMLAANETVAQHFYWMDMPFIYRVHSAPDEDRIRKLSLLINNLGYYMKSMDKRGSKVGSEEVHPKEIQKLLDKTAGKPEEAMIARLTLRSMKQAKYSVISSGHFGLACKYYCHFTSPIRRYPDLQIHRIIKEHLRGRMNDERAAHYRAMLSEVAEESSKLERRADSAERDTEKLKKVEYMEKHIGEEFDGIISGINQWGIYVELPNTVEGFIHVSKLTGDYFYYNESACEMVGNSTGKCYKLGMPVRIYVSECDRINKTIDFELGGL